MTKRKLNHACEWCGARRRQPGCFDGCNPAKDRHADAPATACPRGPACAKELVQHEVDLERAMADGWTRKPDPKFKQSDVTAAA